MVKSGLLPPAPSRTHFLEKYYTHALILLVRPDCVGFFVTRKQHIALVPQLKTVRESGPAPELGLRVEGMDLLRCGVVTEAGSYLRLIDFCITQLKAQGPSRTCDESKEEEEEVEGVDLLLGMEGSMLLPRLVGCLLYRPHLCVCVCVCVRERERETVCVCVCVWVGGWVWVACCCRVWSAASCTVRTFGSTTQVSARQGRAGTKCPIVMRPRLG